jgi:heptaprenyl diphosphate synthase
MKMADTPSSRKVRVDHLSKWINPGWRFLTGLICLMLFISLNQIIFRAVAVIFLGALAIASGKRISWLYFLSFLFFVIFFHLLSPFGLVLVRLGPFPVTNGAILSGLDKGLLFIGFVFNSLFSIERNLKIPGTFGQMVARMFVFFEMLYENKNTIRAKTLLADIDNALSRTWNESASPRQETKKINLARCIFTLFALVLFFSLIKFGDLFVILKFI